ncbi:MAG: hypothetical protein DME96_02445 [Verrucomicrobia bacterium]|nr:MAG: hypothetical protein DME96_02445 [Verrucomicrobiota bacterium]
MSPTVQTSISTEGNEEEGGLQKLTLAFVLFVVLCLYFSVIARGEEISEEAVGDKEDAGCSD